MDPPDLRCANRNCGVSLACKWARDRFPAEEMPTPTGFIKDDGLDYFVGVHYSECHNFQVRKALASDGSTPRLKRYKPKTAQERYGVDLGPNLMVKNHIRRKQNQ